MTPAQFKTWRKSLGLKQKDAAEKLGLKKRMIQYYETGRREGHKVEIPKAVRLACYALQSGVEDFDGATPVTPRGDPNDDEAVTDLKKARMRRQSAGQAV